MPTAPSTTFEREEADRGDAPRQPCRHELEADPLLGRTRVESAGEVREPTGVAVVEAVQQRVAVARRRSPAYAPARRRDA